MQTLNDHQHRVLVALNALGNATTDDLVASTPLPAPAVAKVLGELDGRRLVAKGANGDGVVWQITARGADFLDMES